MDLQDHFSPREEMNSLLEGISDWNGLFSVKRKLFLEGWAIYVKERCLNPRLIVIFRSHEKESYSIKSFLIHLKPNGKEFREELYLREGIDNKESLLDELRRLLYGKDLIHSAARLYNRFFKGIQNSGL